MNKRFRISVIFKSIHALSLKSKRFLDHNIVMSFVQHYNILKKLIELQLEIIYIKWDVMVLGYLHMSAWCLHVLPEAFPKLILCFWIALTLTICWMLVFISTSLNKTTDIQKCICDKTYLQFRGAMSQDRLCNVAILTEYRKRQTLDELVITLLTFFGLWADYKL